jgi:hypothetical protein
MVAGGLTKGPDRRGTCRQCLWPDGGCGFSGLMQMLREIPVEPHRVFPLKAGCCK